MINPQIATTIEQSKVLINIGLSIEASDMYWYTHTKGKISYTQLCTMDEDRDFNTVSERINFLTNSFPSLDVETEAVPAWSLSALLNLISHAETKDGALFVEGANLKFNALSKYDIQVLLYNQDTKTNTEKNTQKDSIFDACINIIKNLKEMNML